MLKIVKELTSAKRLQAFAKALRDVVQHGGRSQGKTDVVQPVMNYSVRQKQAISKFCFFVEANSFGWEGIVVQHDHITRAEHNKITRKNLVYSLATGLAIGIVAGIPLGWIIHQFYSQQRLAQVLLCHERHRNEPEAVVNSICGARY